MDFTKALDYRGLNFNSAIVDPSVPLAAFQRGIIGGITVEEFIVGPVEGVGYSEKRAAGDGRDSSDVYLNGRRFVASGNVFGASWADCHDRFQQLCSVVSPTGAFTASPFTHGYLPLSWYEPTTDTRYEQDEVDPTYRVRPLFANARPLVIPERRWVRDRGGGTRAKGMMLPYTAVWEAADPRIYVEPALIFDLEGAAGVQNGTFLNRGDYPSPLNVMLVVAPTATAKLVTVIGGGATMNITIPISDFEQIIRYNGSTRVLTVEENSIEAQRQDLLAWVTEVQEPMVPPTPLAGSPSAWSVNSNVALLEDSKLFFYEAYA